jgi:transposase-like protein
LKKEIADDIRSIYYASSRKKAFERHKIFANKWERTMPSAVSCLDRFIQSCLTFYKFPKEEWLSLRTTNITERLNKEFKRRTKPMEIVAGENVCYRLLVSISLRMELH